MNFVSIFMAVFSVIGALDLLIGNRFGLGKQFQKGFALFPDMALSMIGMIIIAPLLGTAMEPVSNWIYESLHIDPSLLPAMLFANDMGGASLAESMAKSEEWGLFNGLVVSSMMGCTFSFTIPLALNTVKQEQQKHVLFGFLCGIVTIPIGCLVAGLLRGIPFFAMIFQLLPMIFFSVLVACGLIYIPKVTIKAFGILGNVIKLVILVGLILGILRFLTGVELVKGLASLEVGANICVNACVVLSGAFPFVYILSKVLAKPLRALGKKLDINEASAIGFISSIATNATTFKTMEDMDEKGIVLNSAFAISASFVFGGHLAFTMAFDKSYIGYVIAGKLIAGICGLLVAIFAYKKTYAKK